MAKEVYGGNLAGTKLAFFRIANLFLEAGTAAYHFVFPQSTFSASIGRMVVVKSIMGTAPHQYIEVEYTDQVAGLFTTGSITALTITANGTLNMPNGTVTPSKLFDGPAKSVLGNTQNFTWGHVPIAATAARQFMACNSANTSIGWRAIEAADITAVNGSAISGRVDTGVNNSFNAANSNVQLAGFITSGANGGGIMAVNGSTWAGHYTGAGYSDWAVGTGSGVSWVMRIQNPGSYVAALVNGGIWSTGVGSQFQIDDRSVGGRVHVFYADANYFRVYNNLYGDVFVTSGTATGFLGATLSIGSLSNAGGVLDATVAGIGRAVIRSYAGVGIELALGNLALSGTVGFNIVCSYARVNGSEIITAANIAANIPSIGRADTTLGTGFSSTTGTGAQNVVNLATTVPATGKCRAVARLRVTTTAAGGDITAYFWNATSGTQIGPVYLISSSAIFKGTYIMDEPFDGTVSHSIYIRIQQSVSSAGATAIAVTNSRLNIDRLSP